MVHPVAIILGCLLALFVLAGCLGWALAWLLWIPIPRRLPGRDDKSRLWSFMWRVKFAKVKSYFRAKLSARGTHRVTFLRRYLAQYFGPLKRPVLSGRDPELTVCMTSLGGVPARLYVPKGRGGGGGGCGGGLRAGMVYLHGGGWCTGSADYSDGLTAMLAKKVNMVVASVNYRLAPESCYPAPLDDCVHATKYFMQHAEAEFQTDSTRVAIAGDSAGGNLAAAVALRLRDEGFKPQLKMQVLMYPLLQAVDFHLESHDMNEENPYLDRKFLISCYLWYVTGNNKLLKKVLKKEHLHPRLREKMVPYINKSLLPPEAIEPIRPNKEVLKKGKLAMLDELSGGGGEAAAERTPLLPAATNPFLLAAEDAAVTTADETAAAATEVEETEDQKASTPPVQTMLEDALVPSMTNDRVPEPRGRPLSQPPLVTAAGRVQELQKAGDGEEDQSHADTPRPVPRGERKFSLGSTLEVPLEPRISQQSLPPPLPKQDKDAADPVVAAESLGPVVGECTIVEKESAVLVGPDEDSDGSLMSGGGPDAEVTVHAARVLQVARLLTCPYVSPLLAADLAGLPATYLLTCEHDVVRDENLMYRTRLQRAGVPVEHAHYLSLHALMDCVLDVTYARYALDGLAEWLKRHL